MRGARTSGVPRSCLAILAAALLGACSVKTEGAACLANENCPTGQACGYDRKCSEAAASCGAICLADDCGGPQGAPRHCVVAANGICAGLANQAACAGANQCLLTSGRADCVSLALTGPPNGTVVAPAGDTVPVTATFTATSAGYPAPATLSLVAGTTAVGTLGSPSTAGTVTTYTGTYAPADGIEGEVLLQVAAGSIASATRTVSVDTARPVISSPGASCASSPCLRDGTVVVSATVADLNSVTVKASLDLDGFDAARAVTLTGNGTTFTGQLPLAAWTFPAYARTVTVRVTATDAAGNTAHAQEAVVSGGPVTRARAAYAPGATPITSPAVLPDGTAVAGVAAASGQLHGVRPDGTEAWPPRSLETAAGDGMPVHAAPSAGEVNLFAASSDGRIYRRLLDGTQPSSGSTFFWPGGGIGANVGERFTPWVSTPTPSEDHAFSAGTAQSMLWQLWSSGVAGNTTTTDPVHASGLWVGQKSLLVSSAGTVATLRRFTDGNSSPGADGALALDDGVASPVACDRVSVPLAVDAAGFAVIACDNGQLHRIDVSAATMAAGYLGPLGGAPSGSPVVLPGGDYLVPLANGTILRVADPATASGFTPSIFATLAAGDVPRGLAVSGSGATRFVYATTSTGNFYALDSAGVQLWAEPLGASALDFPTIAPPPPGAPTSALPTLLVGSAEGKLFRVVVEAPLDVAAPWPKAHHDVRNTGNPAAPVNGP